MARRHPIDPDELFETANRLAAEGKDVTATLLLDELGGGSLRTIYKYLEQWKNNAPVVAVKKTTDIPDRVQAGFALAWRMANEEAAIEIEAAKAKAQEAVDLANGRFQEALNAAERLENEAQENSDLIDSLKAQVVALAEELSKEKALCASYKTKSEQLEQQVVSQGQELERMHKASVQEREEHAKQLEKIEASAKKDREERDVAIKEAAELKGLSGALKEQNAALMDKLNSDDKSDKKGNKG